MEIFIKVLQFFLSIAILVLLHELGHFVFAKVFKTRIEKFYLFFNPWFSLFKTKRGETEYGIGWLPLGGYVKIAGMIDESMDKGQLKQPPQPYEFRSKPTWQRLFIILGGVMVNFILALVIYSMILFTWGEEYLPTRNLTYGVACDSLALEMGFRNGDRILLVEGKEVEAFHQVVPEIVLERATSVTVERDGETHEIAILPEFIPKMLKTPRLFQPRFPLTIGFVAKDSYAERADIRVDDKLVAINGTDAFFFDEFVSAIKANRNGSVDLVMDRAGELVKLTVQIPQEGIVGINPSAQAHVFEFKNKQYSFFSAIPAGIKLGVQTFTSYLKQLKLVFSPSTKAYESLGGFISIGSFFPGTWDWQAFWSLTALLSIVLAIMNVLPIPALDGGHLVFILYEMVSGRKPSDKFLEYAQIAGMVFILSLLLYANANDVVKLFR